MLEIRDLECVRGERLLFSALSVRVEPGTCLHVTGENGTGKTSFLRILAGLLAPTAGEVLWGGEAIRRLREEYWQQLVYIGHANGVKDDLTALENLRFYEALTGTVAGSTAAPIENGSAAARRTPGAAKVRAALQRFGLAGFEQMQTRFLSQGQRRRVALARLCLADAAALWILDEPLVALDAHGLAAVAELIAQHLQRKGIVVLTSHQDFSLPGAVQRTQLQVGRAGTQARAGMSA